MDLNKKNHIKGEMSFQEIAETMNISVDKVIIIFNTAIKKLKHPRLKKDLAEYIEMSTTAPENSSDYYDK